MGTETRRIIAMACGIWLACQASASASQRDTDVDAAEDAVSRLASPSWTDRIDATTTLIELAQTLEPETALATLEAALSQWIDASRSTPSHDGDLAEVVARFEMAAMEAYFAGPRAGMGVTYSQSRSEIGVRLGSTVPGFDAHEKLRDGDIVVSIAGVPVEGGSIDLPVAIASHLPGEDAIVEVVRSGEPMEVTVTLGRREDLNTARPLEEALLRRAWAVRMDRFRGDQDRGRLDADRARVVLLAPLPPEFTRGASRLPDVSLGGEPGQHTASRPDVVAQIRRGQNPQAAVRAELDRVLRDLARIGSDIRAAESTIRQIERELRMIADTAAGRAYARQLEERLATARRELAELRQAQTQLMQDRVQLVRALSQ